MRPRTRTAYPQVSQAFAEVTFLQVYCAAAISLFSDFRSFRPLLRVLQCASQVFDHSKEMTAKVITRDPPR
jgi:hypothetical protein